MFQAVYVNNRILTKRSHPSLRNTTLYETISGEKPDLYHSHIFGSLVKVAIPSILKGYKFHKKIWDGILIAYGERGAFRILVFDQKAYLSAGTLYSLKIYTENLHR